MNTFILSQCQLKFKAILFSLIILFHSPSQLAFAEWFEPAEEIVFMETDVSVDLGLNLVSLGLSHHSPCDQIGDHEGQAQVIHVSQQELRSVCQDYYARHLDTAYRTLGSCLPDDHHHQNRFKREPITLLIVATVSIITAIITAVGAFVGWRIYQADVADLRSKNEQQERELQALKDRLDDSHKSTDLVIKAVNESLIKTEENRQAVLQFSQYVPNAAWRASEMVVSMDNEKRWVQKLTRSCKRGRVDLEALQNLVPQPELLAIREDVPIFMEHSKYVKDNLLSLQFHYPMKSNDTKVFEVVAFKHFKDISSQTILMEYHGPQFAIVNSTNNCIKGIVDPGKQRSVYVDCLEPDYFDQNLKNWKPVDYYDLAKLTPQIYKTESTSYISCFGHNITIRGKSRPCPFYQFKLSRDVQFTMGNYTHKVEVLQVKSDGILFKPNKLKLYNTSDDAYDRGSRYLYEAVLKNDASVRARSFLAEELSQLSLMNWVMLLASILGIITFLFSCSRYLFFRNPATHGNDTRNKGGGDNEEHTERINIINQNFREIPEHREVDQACEDYSDLPSRTLHTFDSTLTDTWDEPLSFMSSSSQLYDVPPPVPPPPPPVHPSLSRLTTMSAPPPPTCASSLARSSSTLRPHNHRSRASSHHIPFRRVHSVRSQPF